MKYWFGSLGTFASAVKAVVFVTDGFFVSNVRLEIDDES